MRQSSYVIIAYMQEKLKSFFQSAAMFATTAARKDVCTPRQLKKSVANRFRTPHQGGKASGETFLNTACGRGRKRKRRIDGISCQCAEFTYGSRAGRRSVNGESNIIFRCSACRYASTDCSIAPCDGKISRRDMPFLSRRSLRAPCPFR